MATVEMSKSAETPSPSERRPGGTSPFGAKQKSPARGSFQQYTRRSAITVKRLLQLVNPLIVAWKSSRAALVLAPQQRATTQKTGGLEADTDATA